jgi:hypothetical protein
MAKLKFRRGQALAKLDFLRQQLIVKKQMEYEIKK